MPVEVFMPALGAGQETGTIVTWLYHEGDLVTEGEPLIEVETDKSTVILDAPSTGRLVGVAAREGDEVPVGTVVAQILGENELLAVATPAVSAAPTEETTEQTTPPTLPSPSAPLVERSAVLASPKVRRMATDRGVDLTGIKGSGPHGRIVEADLEESQAGQPDITRPLWRAMAANVSQSWQRIPHFYLVRTVVAEELVAAKGRQPRGVTYTDLFVHVVAQTLRRHPLMNAGSASVNIGLAIGTEAGLLVPVIREADQLDLPEIAIRRAAVVERAKQGKMQAGDLNDATFTISNLGMFGVDLFIAIVSEGQAGILAIGRVVDQAVPRGDGLERLPTIALSLSCDHRLVDGMRAAAFVDDLARALESPSQFVE